MSAVRLKARPARTAFSKKEHSRSNYHILRYMITNHSSIKASKKANIKYTYLNLHKHTYRIHGYICIMFGYTLYNEQR